MALFSCFGFIASLNMNSNFVRFGFEKLKTKTYKSVILELGILHQFYFESLEMFVLAAKGPIWHKTRDYCLIRIN
jgi:hypothetical protein